MWSSRSSTKVVTEQVSRYIGVLLWVPDVSWVYLWRKTRTVDGAPARKGVRHAASDGPIYGHACQQGGNSAARVESCNLYAVRWCADQIKEEEYVRSDLCHWAQALRSGLRRLCLRLYAPAPTARRSAAGRSPPGDIEARGAVRPGAFSRGSAPRAGGRVLAGMRCDAATGALYLT